jgi:hypothetical protein
MFLRFRSRNYTRDKLTKKRGRHAFIIPFSEEDPFRPDPFHNLIEQLDAKTIVKSLTLHEQMIALMMQNHSIAQISTFFRIPYKRLYAMIQRMRKTIIKGAKMLPHIENLTSQQISALPIKDLMQLSDLINRRLAEAKTMKEKIDDGLNLRFSLPLQKELQNLSKDTGTVHFWENDFQITAEVPKKVTWNSEKMEEVAKLLSESTRKQIIKINYSIDEKMYQSLPPPYREALAAARTVTPGKVRYKITPKHAGDAL